MPDFDAIAAAIATRYAPAQVTPPAGLQNIRSSSADLPQAINSGRALLRPVVLVFPDQGELTPSSGGLRRGVSRWLVRFYLTISKDLPRETNALRKWLTVLVDQHKTSLQLGGTVVAVRTLSWRIALLPYAGRMYAGIELGVETITDDTWSPIA